GAAGGARAGRRRRRRPGGDRLGAAPGGVGTISRSRPPAGGVGFCGAGAARCARTDPARLPMRRTTPPLATLATLVALAGLLGTTVPFGVRAATELLARMNILRPPTWDSAIVPRLSAGA